MYGHKVRCKYCLKNITTVNIMRHQKLCKGNQDANREISICHMCGAKYLRKDNFNTHIKKCNGICKEGKIRCMFKECTQKFQKKILLIEHLKNSHKYKVREPIVKDFKSLTEFEEWKAKEEEETFSYFVKHCGERKGRTYFYCQRDGSLKSHIKKGAPERKTTRKVKMGRIKSGQICIAMIQLFVQSDESCSVKYFPTHSHPLDANDLRHQRQSKETYELIDQQIALNMPPAEIVQNVKEYFRRNASGGYSTINKAQLITENLVRFRAQRKKSDIHFERLVGLKYETPIEQHSEENEIKNDSITDTTGSAHKFESENILKENETVLETSVQLVENNEVIENGESSKETIVQILVPGKQWVVSLYSDQYSYVVQKVLDVCLDESCVLKYTSESIHDLCSHCYTCSCTVSSYTCICSHIQEVHSFGLNDLSATEDAVLSSEGMEMVGNSNIKESMLNKLRESCQALIAMTELMPLNVLNMAYNTFDGIVRECEASIDGDPSPDMEYLPQVSSKTINRAQALQNIPFVKVPKKRFQEIFNKLCSPKEALHAKTNLISLLELGHDQK